MANPKGQLFLEEQAKKFNGPGRTSWSSMLVPTLDANEVVAGFMLAFDLELMASLCGEDTRDCPVLSIFFFFSISIFSINLRLLSS